jgi:hypothetical protein
MIVEVNVDYLYDYQISAAQYLFLSLCNNKKFNTADKLVHRNKITIEEIKDLKEKGFILNDVVETDSSKIIFSKVNIGKLFNVSPDKEYFWELVSYFPIKVNSNRGERILRPKSHEAKEMKECKKKYDRILGNKNSKEVHEHILKCLLAELDFRKRNNSLGFMRALTTWLNKQEWYSFEHLIDLSNTSKTTPTYGQQLI